MIVHNDLTIRVGDGQMPAYLARPGSDGRYPAVIVLEGVYGFDDELRRITDLLASLGYAGSPSTIFTARIRPYVCPLRPKDARAVKRPPER